MSMFFSLLLKKKKGGGSDWPGLRFTALEASTIRPSAVNMASTSGIKYRKNDGEWIAVTPGENISLSTGDYIDYWNESTTFSLNPSDYVRFVMSGKLAASGSVMSLLNFADACGDFCFNNLFENCTALVTAPELPSTTLASYCYYHMFYRTGIRTAPVLPATTLVENCYDSMFYGCENLNSIEVNFTEWEDNMSSWVGGVASSGTFTCPSALPEEYGGSRIPEGWTVIRK